MRRLLPRTLLAPLVLALLTLSAPASAYCPCYTLSSSSNNKNCGIEAVEGTNPTTAQWQPIFDLVSQGPAAWGDKGPSVSDIGQGCGKPEAYHTVEARFPCELLKAIAQAESGWTQFCVPSTPADQKGGPSRTIISFDCGYGIAQVTSGMHIGESPSYDRERVASDPTYNLATGTRILAAKWKATECVGDNQPTIIEHWYTATWAYNGLAYSNNPNNPNYDPNRGIYNPDVGGSRPYQEKVFGRMEHTKGKWDPTEVAYPNPGDIGTKSKPPALPEPNCATPTNCNKTRPTHVTACEPGSQGGGGAGGSAGGAMGGGGAGAAAAGGGYEQGGAGGADSELFVPSLGVAGEGDGCNCRFVASPSHDSRTVAPLMLLLAGALMRRRRLGVRHS